MQKASQYEAVIGMEVHAQLLTRSKMFCSCSADYASTPPNTHTCPVCLGMPGMLPVINRAAVEATVLTGMALGCEIPAFSKFDRKNYPYPDLPKGYQISQYDFPFCINGGLDIVSDGVAKRIGIRRVHLEEDTAKLTHVDDASLIDFNRAGVPLMELVTEADMRTAEDAWQYLTTLHTILRYLGVSTGNMEEGAMRCEVNISLRIVGAEAFGTKVEVKNLNSFRAVRGSIAYEIERQTALLEAGQPVVQVTMGWNEDQHCTVMQRSKENSEDYRYFPEPDLPPIELSEADRARIAARLPELPQAKRARYVAELCLREADAILLSDDRATAEWFEAAVEAAGDIAPQTVANWVLGELFRLLSEHGANIETIQVTPVGLVALLGLVDKGTINGDTAKTVLAEMFATGDAAETIVERRGLKQISDDEVLREMIVVLLQANPDPVQQFHEGKQQVIGFFVGQVMRGTRGQANAALVQKILREELAKLG